MKLNQLESKKVRNNKTNEVYYYIGDSIDSTNDRVGTIVALYHKDGKMYSRDKEEFLEKFTFLEGSLDEKKVFILNKTVLNKDIVMNVLSIEEIEDFYLKAVRFNEIDKRAIEISKNNDIRVGQAFSNALSESGIKLSPAFDCFYKDDLLSLAMNEVCSYYKWTWNNIRHINDAPILTK